MAISPLFTSVFDEIHEVDFAECDASGFLSIPSLCQIAQKTATKHSILGGISFQDLQEIKQAWVLNKMRLELRELPKWQDRIHIKTWIESLDGVRSIRNFEISLQNRKIIGISTLWVIINTERRRPESMLLPHGHFEKFNGLTPLKESFKRIPDLSYQALKKAVVEYSDLDMVQHVNNAKYLQWIINAIQSHNLKIQGIKEIDMVFQKEMFGNTAYQIDYTELEQSHYFKIQSPEGTHFLCCIH